MRRREQLADVLRIDELAAKASGQLATASILAARPKGIETIEAATTFASKNPAEIAAALQKDLYFGWISEALTNITKIVTIIDYNKIGTYEAASQSTENIFERAIDKVYYELNHDISGIYPCINSIFEKDRNYSSYTAESLDRIKNVKLIADDIGRAVWRIRHPLYYLSCDRRLQLSFILAFLIAIPIWYLFGAHGASVTAESPRALANEDFRQLLEIAKNQNVGLLTKAAQWVRFLWELLLVVPSLFLVPAAVLAVARRSFAVQSRSVGRYEKLFGDIGRELQKVLPNPPRWPSVEVKMTGDINVAAGQNIQQNVKSIVAGSYNKVKGDYDSDVDQFLKKVADTVGESGNPDAADHYAALVDNLKNDKKSMARSMWKGLAGC